MQNGNYLKIGKVSIPELYFWATAVKENQRRDANALLSIACLPIILSDGKSQVSPQTN